MERRLRRHHLRPDVLGHPLRVTIEGVSVAAAPRKHHPEHVARLQCLLRPVGDRLLVHGETLRPSGLAAQPSEDRIRRVGAAPRPPDADHHRPDRCEIAVRDVELEFLTETAAKPAWSARIAHQFLLQVDDRQVILHGFDGHVADMGSSRSRR